MNVRRERPGDESSIREVNRLAFDRDEEANLVDALRSGGYARLSLVAEGDGRIVGHVLFGEVSADGVSKALALAPVAVVPERQKEGIGSSLIRSGLRICAGEGFDAVFVLGEPGFYSRFGFSTEAAKPFVVPFPKEYFMALETKPGSLDGASGEISYPPPFEESPSE